MNLAIVKLVIMVDIKVSINPKDNAMYNTKLEKYKQSIMCKSANDKSYSISPTQKTSPNKIVKTGSLSKYISVYNKLLCMILYKLAFLSPKHHVVPINKGGTRNNIAMTQYETIQRSNHLIVPITFSRSIYNTDITKDQIRKYNGIIDLSCVTSKNPNELLKLIMKSLKGIKVKPTKNRPYMLSCFKEELKFIVEIMKLEDGLSYLRIKRIEGNKESYAAIVMKLTAIFHIM